MLPEQTKSRLNYALGNRGAADDIEAMLATFAPFGRLYFVNTATGTATAGGTSARSPLSTVTAALAKVSDNDIVYVVGDVREEVLAPLGVQGLRIIGGAGGRTRHDDGVRWREPASGATTGGALLTLREQGCEVHNILFVPKSDGTALRVRRAEDATYPDGSHAVISGCKFIGAATATTKGLEDVGGCHHVLVEGCEFFTLASGLINSSTSIANPLRWTVRHNVFIDNTSHLDCPFTESVVQENFFDHATTNIDVSGGAGGNFVVDNTFSEAAASITNGNGYTCHATDVWRNYATDAIDWGAPS